MDDEKQEPIGPLTGTPEVERAIDGNDVKLCRAQAVILYKDTLDALLEKFGFPKKHDIEFTNPVPVRRFDMRGDVIGAANLHWEGDRLHAEVRLAYDTPERLLLEVDTPTYAESVFTADINRFSDDGTPDGTLVTLESLFLTAKKPTDDRETALRVME